MLIDKALPKVSDNQVESILLSHLQKDQRQFMNTTDAVLNRIRKLKERDFIWDMLSFDVADEHWDHEAGWYDREVVPMLDLKSVLNSDKVILIDTGDITVNPVRCSPCCFCRTSGRQCVRSGRPTTTTTSRTSSSRRVRTSLAPKSSTKTSCRKAASSTSHLD